MRVPHTTQQKTALQGLVVVAMLAIATMVAIALAGCGAPNWRIFQKKIDPKMADPTERTIEGQREAAQFIEVKSAPNSLGPKPTADNYAEAMREIHEVAFGLSASLGEPKREIKVEDYSKIIAELRAGALAEQKKREAWQQFARKYANVPLEDTGINLAGPAGILVLVGIIAACVAFPALGYLLLRVIPVLFGFVRTTTQGVANFMATRPDAAADLQANLGRKMDRAHKAIVKRLDPKPEAP